METDEQTITFENVSIDEFFDKDDTPQNDISTGIVVLTPKQKEMVDDLCERMVVVAPEQLNNITDRMSRLEGLAKSLATFPSLLERANLTAEVRTPQALIESLITHTQDGDNTLQLPSKATLGRGFLVAKIHTFSSLNKLSKSVGMAKKVSQAFQDETVSMMFLLLAEDVYLNLIRDTNLEMDFRRQLALSLLLLWEHRADQNISDISPVLQTVWKARRALAPAFGTMMGTSELIMISFQMDDQWSAFIKTKLAIPEVSQAMEEFLFGLSFEQINKLKSILREKGIPAIGRDEVSQYLGEHIKTDVSMDYRDFFTQYSIRRDNARARRRIGLPGPHRTLEDLFIRFVMESNRDKQNNDVYAKEE
ncbi:MAG: hypothetical protein II684_04095 [Treponema sp.]|nr:hypothetical protein [Treponema sp.]